MAKPEEKSFSDLVRRGRAFYDERVRPNVDEDARRGAVVAIDTETGEFEVGPGKLEVMDRLEEREPKARGRIWLTRVGLGHAVRFGGQFEITFGEDRRPQITPVKEAPFD